MVRIYKKSDRIPVRIGNITVRLAPLSKDEKTEIQLCMIRGRGNNDYKELTNGLFLSLKYAVKGIDGITDGDGNKYELQFDDNKNLTDDCVSDLLNMEEKDKLTLVCISLINKIPDEFTDEKGKKLEGVEIIKATGNPEKNAVS